MLQNFVEVETVGFPFIFPFGLFLAPFVQFWLSFHFFTALLRPFFFFDFKIGLVKVFWDYTIGFKRYEI